MVAKATFHGQFYYYENINGKQKKVEKSFTDKKKYDNFVGKYPLPTLSDFWGLKAPAKKALPVKKSPKSCASCSKKKK
ncbi:MAG: hypothetical protein WC875_02005 [Candidatus Absconditabacterales bacterium]|jgi:hypothetical protein